MSTSLPVILISGFLGAGKTTLVRHLLTSAQEQSITVALVVNEFGDVDVDSYLLENYGAEFIASIAGGCACCGGQDDLMETLEEISARPQNERPDVVLIEASGAADPLALIDVITAPSLLTSVRLATMVAVADSTRLEDLHGALGPILQSQLQLADPIILNKVDLISGDQQAAIATIKSFHPAAQILPASQGEIDAQAFWQNALVSSKVLSSEGHTHFHFAYQSVLCPLPHPVSKEKLKAAGFDVLLDDRNERPGVKFAEADLCGIPRRVVLGKKYIESGEVEVKRLGDESTFVELDEIVNAVKAL